MKFHLLIVDDEPTIRKGLSSFIQWDTLDCVVDGTACDGAEAIERIQIKQPDIVITDIRMPQVDGLALAKHIYEHFPEIKVIILTGYADFHYAQSAIRFSVSDFILKPTSREKLTEAVKKAQESIAESRNKTLVSKADFAYLREQFLQEMTRKERPEAIACEKAVYYEIELAYYYVAAFQIHEYSTERTEETSIILKEALEQEEGQNYTYSYENRFVLWITRIPEDKKDSLFGIIKHCEDIISSMKLLYGLEVSVGISECHHGLSQLAIATKEAISAGNMNFYQDSVVCAYDAVEETLLYGVEPEYVLDLYQLENHLKIKDFEGARQEIKSLFSRLKVTLTVAFEVKNICIQIYYICCRILMKKKLPPVAPDILQEIQSATTIGQLELFVNQMFEYTTDFLMKQGQGLNPLNEKAIQYIHSNLSDPISLEVIAAHVHVNPSHLSRIFKKECKVSLTEYINKIRIEKAQELLSNSHALTYEVAEQVGFHDPAYFSATFKKYAGMSPKEFKQKNN